MKQPQRTLWLELTTPICPLMQALIKRMCTPYHQVSAEGGDVVINLSRRVGRNQPPDELPTLTKTTWTLANLFRISMCVIVQERGGTHAAVAAKISILLAFVASARTKEKRRVKPHTRPSLILMLWIIYSTMIEIIGVNDDATVPIMLMTLLTCSSE